ncbi:MAG: PfkB family carbohydrate kinase [Oscillospiraceae bacterium]
MAKIAEVSVSTVSKIINNKDSNISRETRERVLKIVKAYHYVPYSGVQAAGSNSFLIGILVDGSKNHNRFASEMVSAAKKEGYSSILCSSDTAEEELENIASLGAYNVSGIVWDQLANSSSAAKAAIEKYKIPVVGMNDWEAPSSENPLMDYEKLGYIAAKCLVEHNHKKILCVIDSEEHHQQQFVKGYQQCLVDFSIPLQESLIASPREQWGELAVKRLLENTGIVCFDVATAAPIYALSFRKKFNIPKSLSVIALSDDQKSYFVPDLSVISLPYRALAKHISRKLIGEIEGNDEEKLPFATNAVVSSLSSVDIPENLRQKKIVVVGSLNMDTLAALKEFPKIGETAATEYRTVTPGGKGLNQAVGVAKLGMEVFLIGKVGKDYEGSSLFDFLLSNKVNAEGVTNTSLAATGHAYIYVQRDGESGIVLYDGANGKLTEQDVLQNTPLFENASFCLLQTEIDIKVVECAAELAYKNQAKIILKPSAIETVSDELLKKIYLFMPNEQEMRRLCPSHMELGEMAAYYLQKGVENVIITLGSRGCFWSNGEEQRYYPAEKFKAIDTTGAADAFAATLAVYLSSGFDMDLAIKYAVYAAGFSTTNRGVPNSLIDKATLEFNMAEKIIGNNEKGSR